TRRAVWAAASAIIGIGTTGRADFFRMAPVRRVDRADGSTATVEVTGVKRYAKAASPRVDCTARRDGAERVRTDVADGRRGLPVRCRTDRRAPRGLIAGPRRDVPSGPDGRSRRRVHLQLPGGEAAPQHLLVELADRGARHLVDEGEGLRQLPLGEASGEELAQLVGGDVRALPDDDGGQGPLLPLLV